MNPNDAIREQILRWFYDRNSSATSQYGKKGSAVKISDVKKGLKERHALTQQQVMSNLTYLLDKGWIKKTQIEKTVNVKGGTVPSTVVWYEISSDGIDRIEGSSEFKQVPRYQGININASGMNVITMGDGNVVNPRFADLHRELNDLKQVVTKSRLDERQKLDVAVDIESMRDQLAKAAPDRRVVGLLWSRIEQVATIGGFVEAACKAGAIIKTLFP